MEQMMGLAELNHVEENSSGGVEEFISIFKEEISNQLAFIRDELAKVDEDPENISVFENIKKSAEIITDLAMVYGYEGVEAIGHRIVEALSNYSDELNFGDLIIKLENAAKAIKDAMILVDEKKERKVIRELSELSTPEEVVSESEPISDVNDGEVTDAGDTAFDIREDENLISLLSDTDGQAIEMEAKTEEDDVLDIEGELIIGEQFSDIDFDIPSKNDEANSIDEIVESEILEIDFKNDHDEQESEGEGLLKKIGSLFGKKHS